MDSITRPHSFRHESVVAQIIFVDVDNNKTGQLGEKETFVKVDGLWYPERTIKAGAIGYRDDQLNASYPTAAETVDKSWKDTLEQDRYERTNINTDEDTPADRS